MPCPSELDQAALEAMDARYQAARRSNAAWDAYCESLEPGLEMDFAVQCASLPTTLERMREYEALLRDSDDEDDLAATARIVPPASSDLDSIISCLLDEGYSFTISRSARDKRPVVYRVEVRHDRYAGGTGEASFDEGQAVAACRAVLDLYSPTEEELVDEPPPVPVVHRLTVSPGFHSESFKPLPAGCDPRILAMIISQPQPDGDYSTTCYKSAATELD